MSQKLGIGIVGLGNIADIHAQAIVESENAELVCAYSRDKVKAKYFAEKYSISGYCDLTEFINDPNLDAVVICTPNGTHLDLGRKLAMAKKHIIVEKPIEVTLNAAQKLIDICSENGVQLAVIYQNRFIDKMSSVKRTISENKLGKLFLGDAYIKWYRSQDYYDSGDWRGTLALDGGGVLINQGIHTVDLLQWLMGDVESVFAQAGTFTHHLEGEDNVAAVLRFKSGAIGVIEASTSVKPAQSRRLEIHGEKGSIVIEDDKINILLEEEDNIENDDSLDKEASASTSPLAGFSIQPHKRQIESIVDAIRTNKTPTVSGEESLNSLAIVLAIYKAVKNGQNINLDKFKADRSN